MPEDFDEVKIYPCYGAMLVRNFPTESREWRRITRCRTCRIPECRKSESYSLNAYQRLVEIRKKWERAEDPIRW